MIIIGRLEDGREVVQTHGGIIVRPTERPRQYLIWSHEHGGWWGPERCGYYQTVAKAGRYGRDEAMKTCHDAGWHGGWKQGQKVPNEIPVLESDALELERKAAGP